MYLGRLQHILVALGFVGLFAILWFA